MPPGGAPEQMAADTAALQADLALVERMLRETLARQVGPHLPGLVDEVQRLAASPEPPAGGPAASRLDALLDGLDLDTTIALVRACTAYFHLANIVEQAHRADLLGAGPGWLETAVDRILEAGLPEDDIREVLARLELRPVLTAHPTEATRWSTLSKLSAIAGLLERRRRAALPAAEVEEIDRELAATIEALWQTDELRHARPTPIDEARQAIYWLLSLFEVVGAAVGPRRPPTGPARGGPAAGGGSLALRHLGRGRPRRQPGGDRRGDAGGAGPPARPRPGPAAGRRRRARGRVVVLDHGGGGLARNWKPRWRPTPPPCPRWRPATAPATPASPTG